MSAPLINHWPRVRLADIAHVVRGSSPRPAGDARYFNGTVLPWITVGDLTRNEAPFLESTSSFLTAEGAERTRVFEPGTVLLTNSGATLGVPKITGLRAGANDGVAGFLELSKEVDSLYLYYCLLSLTDYFRTDVASGVGQPNLNTELIGNVYVSKPSLAEQKAIAACLWVWDRAIQQNSDLLSATLRLKQGLTQQLVTGRSRFSEYSGKDLHPTPLKEVLVKVADPIEVDPQATYREIGIRSHGKGIFHKEPVSGRLLGNKRVYPVIPGCLTANIVFAWERALAVTTEKEAGMIASHRFPMFRPNCERLVAEYALLYLLSHKGTEVLQLASPGGAGRNRTLSQTQLLNTIVPLPTIDEQHRIVGFVQTAEREIKLLRKQLDALREQKKGLMQKLLTGQVRVKP